MYIHYFIDSTCSFASLHVYLIENLLVGRGQTLRCNLLLKDILANILLFPSFKF